MTDPSIGALVYGDRGNEKMGRQKVGKRELIPLIVGPVLAVVLIIIIWIGYSVVVEKSIELWILCLITTLVICCFIIVGIANDLRIVFYKGTRIQIHENALVVPFGERIYPLLMNRETGHGNSSRKILFTESEHHFKRKVQLPRYLAMAGLGFVSLIVIVYTITIYSIQPEEAGNFLLVIAILLSPLIYLIYRALTVRARFIIDDNGLTIPKYRMIWHRQGADYMSFSDVSFAHSFIFYPNYIEKTDTYSGRPLKQLRIYLADNEYFTISENVTDNFDRMVDTFASKGILLIKIRCCNWPVLTINTKNAIQCKRCHVILIDDYRKGRSSK